MTLYQAPRRRWKVAAGVFVVASVITLGGTLLVAQSYASDQHTPGSHESVAPQTGASKNSWQTTAVAIARERQLGDIAKKLLTNDAELKTSEAKIASLKKLVEELPPTIVTQKVEASRPEFEAVSQKLHQAQAREQELARTMQDDHPQLQAVRQQIADLRANLAGQPTQRTQATEAPNPRRQALELDLAKEQSAADSLRGRGRELLALRERLQGELQKLIVHEAEVNQRRQEVELAEASHKDDVPKLEQAPMTRSLEEERAISLSIVQPASNAAESTGPSRLYLLALGVLLCSLSSLLISRRRPAFVRINGLSELLDVPLVGTLPRDVFQPTARA